MVGLQSVESNSGTEHCWQRTGWDAFHAPMCHDVPCTSRHYEHKSRNHIPHFLWRCANLNPIWKGRVTYQVSKGIFHVPWIYQKQCLTMANQWPSCFKGTWNNWFVWFRPLPLDSPHPNPQVHTFSNWLSCVELAFPHFAQPQTVLKCLGTIGTCHTDSM